MSQDSVVHEQIENNKNKHKVRCQFCKSLILREELGHYVQNKVDLPLMQQICTMDIESEAQCHFWAIDDMYSFDNIAFSHTMGNKKYLVCADCEMGPVGYHNTEDKKCYIAIKRVTHAS